MRYGDTISTNTSARKNIIPIESITVWNVRCKKLIQTKIVILRLPITRRIYGLNRIELRRYWITVVSLRFECLISCSADPQQTRVVLILAKNSSVEVVVEHAVRASLREVGPNSVTKYGNEDLVANFFVKIFEECGANWIRRVSSIPILKCIS